MFIPSLPVGYYQDYLLCWGSLKSDEQRLFVDWADLRRAYSAVTYVYVDERSKTPISQLGFQSVGS